MAKPIAPDYGQQFLLPPALEDWVAPDHPARFLREFVEQLDLAALGFALPAATEGRPPFAPSLLLKIWLYGYFQRLRSTRKLEAAWPSAKPCAIIEIIAQPGGAEIGAAVDSAATRDTAEEAGDAQKKAAQARGQPFKLASTDSYR